VRLKFPPIVTDGRIVVVFSGRDGDRVFERLAEWPLGTWGEIQLPAEVIAASQSAPAKAVTGRGRGVKKS